MSKKQRRIEQANQKKWSSPTWAVGVDFAKARDAVTAEYAEEFFSDMIKPPEAEASGGFNEVENPVVATKPPTSTWDDVIGQEGAKAALIDAIETPIVHAELFRRYGQRHSKGVLLYGPPGCGKTILAKAAAASFAALQPKMPAPKRKETYSGIHGFAQMMMTPEEKPVSDDAFIYLKGPELKSMWHGKTEENIRDLFTRARRYHKATGCRSLVFRR